MSYILRNYLPISSVFLARIASHIEDLTNKPFKVAIVGIMRRLIVLLNSMIATNTMWMCGT